MALLKCKTRGDSSPQGKPRVYFCCHPTEYGAFFEDISNEILGKQNCAVWYLPNPNAERSEELLADLKQMQLFVMLVTSRLLCTQNPALDIDFRFAIDNHIPVLPLMQESSLEKLFNEKCGDLQFLDKYNTDTTAISYDEKLETYLNSILIGDALAEKIRAAFDAYVFLSYRKKDRKYAQELMRLIHKNDFCRDIAIWYDEFLTPGENFNDSIKEALKKSGLFVLAVTPNLVNETNYIMTTEYPMARDAKKPILPAELVPTDKTQLSEKYTDIPPCTDAHDEPALSQALFNALQTIAIQENDNSPEHNFFIGLAYLGGVDVEVDHERALSLITSAAEAGLVEAITKMVEMYRSGLGVERNYKTAIVWQERKIEVQKEEYEHSPSVHNLNELFCTICECGDQYRELQKLEKAKEKYTRGIQLIDTSAHTDSPVIRSNLSVSYNRLGDIAKAQGDIDKALAYFKKGLALCEAMVQESGTIEARRDLSISYEKLGDIAKAQGDLATAKAYFEKMLAIREAIVQESGTIEVRRDLSISYNRLGDIAKAQGDIDKALAYFKKGLALCEAMVQESGTIEARRDLSISYEKLGDIAKAQGDLATAKAYFEKVLTICEAIVQESYTIEARRDLSVSYERLGDLAKAQGDLATAKAYFEKVLAIREAIVQESSTIEARRDLSVSYNRLGDIAMAQGDLATAKAYFEELLAISEAIVQESGTIDARRDLSISYNKLGDIAMEQGDLATAKAYFEKVLTIREAIVQESGTIETRRDLSFSYNRLGDIAKAQKDLAAAKAYFEKGLAIREAIVQESGTIEARRGLSISYERLGDIAMAQEDLVTALIYFEKDLAISEAIAQKSGTIEAQRDLSVSYNRLGDIATAQGELATAKAYFEKCLAIRETIMQKSGTIEARRDLSFSYNRLGDIAMAQGELAAAHAYFEKGLALSEAIAQKSGTAENWDDLAVGYYKIAMVSPEKKTELLKAAAYIYRQLCQACPNVKRYTDNLEYIKSLLRQ